MDGSQLAGTMGGQRLNGNGTMGTFSGTNQIGQQLPLRDEQPFQGERPDMDSDENDEGEQRDGAE